MVVKAHSSSQAGLDGAFSISGHPGGTDADLPGCEIDVFHAQPQAFHEAEACTVQNAGHNFFPPGKMQQNAADLVLSQDHGKALRPFSPLDILESAKLFVKNVFIEKNDGIQGLILGGCGDVLLGGQMGEKGSDFRFSHILGVAFMMKKDILENPANITFFGLVAIMSSADNIAHLIEEFFLCHWSLL